MRNFTFAILCGFSSLALAQGGPHHPPSGHHHHHRQYQHGHHQPHQHHQHNHAYGSNDYAADFAAAEWAAQVLVEQCWVRLLPSTVPSAGYFVIRNESAKDVELIAAATPSYEQVMLHETIEINGMAAMQNVEKIIIPAQSALEFKPGGWHAMYEQPTEDLAVGSTIDLEFLFSTKQKISTTCKVNPANARGY